MLPNILLIKASRSSLDIFDRLPLLITFDTRLEKENGSVYVPNGPTLEFEWVGGRPNFIDLRIFYLEIKFKILKSIAKKLDHEATKSDWPFFVNNTLHSQFS